MRKITAEDIVGKTVKSFENNCANYLKLEFTDGTCIELYAEDSVNTPAGTIPGIFVEDGNAPWR